MAKKAESVRHLNKRRAKAGRGKLTGKALHGRRVKAGKLRAKRTAAKGKRKGHKISPAQRKAMILGRAKWLKSAGGAAFRKHMAALRKAGAIGKGAKGKHSNRGKMAGKFKNEKKRVAKGKKKAHAKGRAGGKHHARKHGKHARHHARKGRKGGHKR